MHKPSPLCLRDSEEASGTREEGEEEREQAGETGDRWVADGAGVVGHGGRFGLRRPLVGSEKRGDKGLLTF